MVLLVCGVALVVTLCCGLLLYLGYCDCIVLYVCVGYCVLGCCIGLFGIVYCGGVLFVFGSVRLCSVL